MPHENRVSLSPDLPLRLRRLAMAAAPREFVALLVGPTCLAELVADHVLPLTNQAPALDRFEVDAGEFACAEAALRRSGRRWLGFVHSHPRGPATLSSIDRRLLWPHCLQLVVGLAPTPADGPWLRAFRSDGVAWRELAIDAVEPPPRAETCPAAAEERS